MNTIRLSAIDIAGNNGTQVNAFVIEIDTLSPSNFTLYFPTTYVNTQTPTVIISVFAGDIGTSGINNMSAQSAYSIDGNSTPTNWAPITGVFDYRLLYVFMPQMERLGLFMLKLRGYISIKIPIH